CSKGVVVLRLVEITAFEGVTTQEPPHEIRYIHVEGLALVGVKEHCEGTRNIGKGRGVHQRSGETTGSDGRVVGGGSKTYSRGLIRCCQWGEVNVRGAGIKIRITFFVAQGPVVGVNVSIVAHDRSAVSPLCSGRLAALLVIRKEVAIPGAHHQP